MPFKSRNQAAYFNIHRVDLEAKGVDVDKWNRESKGLKLPKKIKKRKREKRNSYNKLYK